LYLFVSSHHEEGVDRWSRGRFLDRVIAEAQRFHGVLAGTMARGPALGFLRLGRSLERADMTGRVLDARAVPLLAAPAGSHAEVQWSAVLRSLSALPAYHQRGLAPVAGRPAVDLLLHDPDLPSSIACCLTEVSAALAELPRSEAPAAAATAARRALAATTPWPAPALHDGLGRLRSAIAAVHDEVQATWFPPLPPAPPAPPDDASPPSPSPSRSPSPSPSPAPSTAPPGTPAPAPPGSSPGAPTAAGTRAD
ncbi:MAG TPA: alpha-E domain-containing protein, partial [Acidimicrobiales bacterium]